MHIYLPIFVYVYIYIHIHIRLLMLFLHVHSQSCCASLWALLGLCLMGTAGTPRHDNVFMVPNHSHVVASHCQIPRRHRKQVFRRDELERV